MDFFEYQWEKILIDNEYNKNNLSKIHNVLGTNIEDMKINFLDNYEQIPNSTRFIKGILIINTC